jgi:GntR family transcriptional regulator, transcriptional repressor for pyruvate dehydrogenase complex
MGTMSPGEGGAAGAVGDGPAPRARPRLKVTDEILEAVRGDIVSGRLARGSRLPNERDLAHRFGVSQPTMREVVRALEAMGLVEVRHGSGAWVTGNSGYLIAAGLQTLMQLEQVSLLEAVDVRKILGLESVRIAATERTDEDLDDIRARLYQLKLVEQIADVDAVIDQIAGFQVAVSAAAHRPLLYALESFLIQLQMQMQVKALKSRGVRYWRQRSLSFQDDRKSIVRAVEAKDSEAAVAAMDRYLEHTRAAFLSDPAVLSIRLTDKKAADAVAAIVHALRGG